MACETKTVSVLVHEGRVGATTCEWCRDHIDDKFVTEGSAGEPYRLPAHEKCHCAWQITKITGITRSMAEKVRAVLEETTEEADNSDSIQVDKIQIMDECLVIAEQATEDAEDSAAQSEAYYAEAADWLEQSEVAFALAESYEEIQEEQQQIMNECLATADQATDNADAAYAASLISYGLAADFLALSEAALSQAEAYEGIQAEQQILMDAATTDIALHQDEADAAAATEADYQEDLDAANISYSACEDEIQAYLDIQATQQGIMDAVEANMAIQQGFADAASASESDFNESAADYLADYYSVQATITEYEGIQATQLGLMAAAEGAIAQDQATCAQYEDESSAHLDEAADWLEQYDAAYAQFEDYNALADMYSSDMAYWLNQNDIAVDDAEEANYYYELYLTYADEWYAEADEWYELGDEYYAVNDDENGDYCYGQGDICTGYGQADDATAQGWLDEYDDAVDRINESDEAFHISEDNYDEVHVLELYWFNETNTCSKNYHDELDAAEADQETADLYQTYVDAHQDEYDAANASYEAHDTANLEIEAADLLDCYNEDHAKALAAHDDYLAAIAAVAGYQDEYDAAQAIYDAHNTAPLVAELADWQTSIDTAQAGVTLYHAAYLAALSAKADAQAEYDAALAVFNAHDPAPLYAQAAADLQTSNDYQAEGDGYVASALAALAIADQAMDNYDAAEAIYQAHDPAALYAQAATYLQSSESCTDLAVYWAAQSVIFWGTAADALEDHDDAQFVLLGEEDRISILTEPITRYTNCQENLIIEDELAKLGVT